jgi:hypothetical protein
MGGLVGREFVWKKLGGILAAPRAGSQTFQDTGAEVAGEAL